MQCPDCEIQVPDTENEAMDYFELRIAHVDGPEHRMPQLGEWANRLRALYPSDE